MNKKCCLLMLIIVLLSLAASISFAETIYQTNYFEILLPDEWYYDSSLNLYRCKKTNALLMLSEKKEKTIGSDDLDAVIEEMLEIIGTDRDHSAWENMIVDGQMTLLITYFTDAGNTGYCTAIRNGSRACYAAFACSNTTEAKETFLSLLQRFHVRPEEDACYFRYYNVDAKFKGYMTKTVGGKKYLLVDFSWRNVGTSPTMFIANVDVTAYQDGIELHDGFIFGENTEAGTMIMPGKELVSTVVFEMRSQAGEITLIVDRVVDIMGEYPDRQYSFTITR